MQGPDLLSQDAEALAAEIDHDYATGNLDDVADKEARLESMFQEFDPSEYEDDRLNEGVSIEEQLAQDWVVWQKGGNAAAGRSREDILGHMRAVLDDSQVGGQTPAGLVENATDVQILAAAKDAFDRKAQLRAKLRESAVTGQLDRVRRFLEERGVDTSYFQCPRPPARFPGPGADVKFPCAK